MSRPVEHIRPADIEARSFEIITEELAAMGCVLEGDNADVIKRVIHTTADFDYRHTLFFSDYAVQDALDAIRNGAHIITDTNMGKAGINKKVLERYGGQVHCFMADADVAETAKKNGTTRAVASMEKAAALDVPCIFAIGNAPTALLHLCDMIEAGTLKPAFIIGAPVGFVNVEAAKERLMEQNVPCIVARGRKGGSNVVAAICNALLYKLGR